MIRWMFTSSPKIPSMITITARLGIRRISQKVQYGRDLNADDQCSVLTVSFTLINHRKFEFFIQNSKIFVWFFGIFPESRSSLSCFIGSFRTESVCYSGNWAWFFQHKRLDTFHQCGEFSTNRFSLNTVPITVHFVRSWSVASIHWSTDHRWCVHRPTQIGAGLKHFRFQFGNLT